MRLPRFLSPLFHHYTHHNMHSNALNVPFETWAHILSHCSRADAHAVILTCRHLRRVGTLALFSTLNSDTPAKPLNREKSIQLAVSLTSHPHLADAAHRRTRSLIMDLRCRSATYFSSSTYHSPQHSTHTSPLQTLPYVLKVIRNTICHPHIFQHLRVLVVLYSDHELLFNTELAREDVLPSLTHLTVSTW